MEYIGKIHHAGSTIEAHVDVRMCHGDIEAEFCTSLAYVDDEVVLLDEVSETLQMLLIDDAHDQWAMEVDES
jgi:aminoglycoside phosphotransferase family enzyme